MAGQRERVPTEGESGRERLARVGAAGERQLQQVAARGERALAAALGEVVRQLERHCVAVERERGDAPIFVVDLAGVHQQI